MESALIRSIDTPALEDVTFDVAEAIVGGFLEGGVLRNLPMVGAVTAVARTIGSVRDHLFLRKVVRFLIGVSAIPVEKRRQCSARWRKKGRREVWRRTCCWRRTDQLSSA